MMAEGPQVRGLWLFYTHLRARLISSASPLKDLEVVVVVFCFVFGFKRHWLINLVGLWIFLCIQKKVLIVSFQILFKIFLS